MKVDEKIAAIKTITIQVDAEEAIETLKKVAEVANEAYEALAKLEGKFEANTSPNVAQALVGYIKIQEKKRGVK
ncbi:hypothetical protein QMA02_14550 [Bacillus wiedmannii]|uniref:hypothetical protein n=1 Tax=Bacillus wiedmannii TaxID=1890302 RepID=UPI0024AE698D|nr:hypothetical protein [Bacillus wiedmannii]MDI6677063.1 hypothetical protein [Bacillus wiedmannii]